MDQTPSVLNQAPENSRLKPIAVRYTNWKGETRDRIILLDSTCGQHLWFGANQWHPVQQWLLHAFDPEDGQWKHFALKDCDFRVVQPPQ